MLLIPTLMTRLDYWECWAYVALTLVFVGVLIETVPEFFDFPRSERGKRRARRIGGGLLLLGLAGEGLTLWKTSATTSILVAELNQQSADANARAAEADSKTASLLGELYGNRNPGDHLSFVNRAVLKRVTDRLDVIERRLDEMSRQHSSTGGR